jgi:hypothetical protein
MVNLEIGWPDFPEILAPIGDPNFSRGPGSPNPCFEGIGAFAGLRCSGRPVALRGKRRAGALLITSC